MSKYTTGELAKLCAVSVRTVQFYDTKNLLKPTELTDGGRRLYSDEDLKKLRLICMLKSLGLSLDSIKGILDSEAPNQVLLLLLDEQAKQIAVDIQEKQRQIRAIEIIKESVRSQNAIPVNSIQDIEHMMSSKKLKRTRATMLVIGILMDIIEIATIALWIAKGMWLPFAIGMPVVIVAAVWLVRMYYRNTAYICAQCNEKFKPAFQQFFFASHTPKTRKLVCPKCGHKGYCVETSAED